MLGCTGGKNVLEWEMRRVILICLALLGGAAHLAQSAGAAAEPGGEDRSALGHHLAALLAHGRNVVSGYQDLINDPERADKGIDGESVVAEAVERYTQSEGVPPITTDMPELDRRLTQALMDSMAEIVEEHEAQIDTPGVGFKGFIPAVYGRLVSERFNEKVGTEALMKVTAPLELVRNRKALPDEWERGVIETRFLRPDWTEGEAFTETTERDGRPATRMLIPEYYSASCLTCHGQPKGEVDLTGYPKEGGEEGDLAGAISITFFE